MQPLSAITPALLLLLTLASACGERERPEQTAVTLAEQVIAQGDYLDSPRRMAVVGDRLVLLDRSAPMVHVFRLPDGHRIGSFGREGDGPGEFRGPATVHADLEAPGAFWVFDNGLNRLTRFRFTHPDSLPRLGDMANFQGTSGHHFQSVWLSDSTVVASGIYLDQAAIRLLVTDRSGRPRRTIGTLPEHPGGSGIPGSVLQHAYEARFAVHPDRGRIAVGTRHADRLEIYRADGTLVRQITGGDGFIPVFEVNRRAGGASMATGDDLRIGYLDLAATHRHVFALFSGNTRGEMRGRTYTGKEVHVYDWEGERVATLALAERAHSIAVDTAAPGYLYAVRDEPAPRIVRHTLPKGFGVNGGGPGSW